MLPCFQDIIQIIPEKNVPLGSYTQMSRNQAKQGLSYTTLKARFYFLYAPEGTFCARKPLLANDLPRTTLCYLIVHTDVNNNIDLNLLLFLERILNDEHGS